MFPPGRAKPSAVPGRDRIRRCRHDNGNRLGRLLGCEDRLERHGDDHIDIELNEIGHMRRELFHLSPNVTILDSNIFLLRIA